MVSWPHFDLFSIVYAAFGAIAGWVAKLIQQNKPK